MPSIINGDAAVCTISTATAHILPSSWSRALVSIIRMVHAREFAIRYIVIILVDVAAHVGCIDRDIVVYTIVFVTAIHGSGVIL